MSLNQGTLEHSLVAHHTWQTFMWENTSNFIPAKDSLIHFQWAPIFLKGYHTEQFNTTLAQTGPITPRKLIWILSEAMRSFHTVSAIILIVLVLFSFILFV